MAGTSPLVGEDGRGAFPLTLTRLAQTLRRKPTPAEVRLWRLLFPLRTGGFHFRKQAPIGPYIADFACHHARLVVEVDGDTHGTEAGIVRDWQRDAFLSGEGYTVLHFSNHDVLHNSEGVSAVIATALSDITPQRRETTPLPSSPTRGEVDPWHARAPIGILPLVGRDGEGDS